MIRMRSVRAGQRGPTLIGASSVAPLESSVAALHNMAFTDEDLAAIDNHAVDGGISIWSAERPA